MRVLFLSLLFCVVANADDTLMPLNVPYNDVLSVPATEPTGTFSYGESALQNVSFWHAMPEQTQTKPNVLVFIHGGCWLNQFDRSHSDAMSSAISQAGINVYSLEYRRVGDLGGGWPGSMLDIEAAVKAVKQHVKATFGDANITLAGHSAGGHLALMAAARTPDDIAQVIGLAAITDIVAYANQEGSCQSATPKFIGAMPDEQPDKYAQANPVNFTYSMPVILLRGTEDKIVPANHTNVDSAEIITLGGAGHFDYLHPDTAAFKTFINRIRTP